MSKEYIFELGDALYNEETGEACFNPVVKGELIRCKDCKWWKTNYMWNGTERKVCVKEPYEPVRASDFFCADGVRKEKDG